MATTRSAAPPDGTALAIGVTACSFVLAALPTFLVGGLAVQIRADLQLSATALGTAVSLAFVTAAIAGPIGGRLADRLGARRAVLAGAAISSASLAGIGLLADDWATLLAFLVVGGLAVAITDPGLAVLIDRAITPRLHGVAFGIKESAIPVASLIAGITVPAIAVTWGWRWALSVGVLFLAGLIVLLPRIRVDLDRRPVPPPSATTADVTDATAPAVPRRALVLVAAATAMGMTAAGGISVFLTQSAVAMGQSESAAGVLLAFGGIAGVVTRIAMGVVADRSGTEQFRVIAAMLLLGAVGAALGATGATALLPVATLVVFTAGWGWSGLLLLSLIRSMPAAPGRAAGVGVVGLASGTALGPSVFGAVADTWSYAGAWGLSSALMVVAAALMRQTATAMSADHW